MRDLILFAIAGFAASFVDGALGMGFGPTSSSILLVSGLAPAAVSTSVNLAKVITGLVSGLSHWQFRNLDRGLVLRLTVPGCLGALVGGLVLSNVNGATLRPYLAVLLSLVGVRMLVRFARPLPPKAKTTLVARGRDGWALAYDQRGVTSVAFLGGITNGLVGAWGPVVTPFLLHRSVRPRFAIGCVNTAEIAVASAAAFSLLASLGTAGVDGRLLVAMLLGGAVAAPIAAWLVRYVPPGPLGVAVAGLLLLTSARELMTWSGLPSGPPAWAVYIGIVGLVIFAVFVLRERTTRSRSAASRTSSGVTAASQAQLH